MTRSRIVALAALAAALLAIAIWFFTRPSDEQKIRAQVARVAAAVKVTEDDTNPLFRLARIKDIFRDTLDKNAHVSLADVPTLPRSGSGRDQLAETATQATAVFLTADVDLSGVDVKLDDARLQAEVKAKATLVAVGRDGKLRRESRAVDFHVVLMEGTWRITSITLWTKEPD